MAQRLRVFSALSAVVLGLHACAGYRLSQHLADFRHETTLPERMKVVYLQTLQISAPPPISTPPPPAPAPPQLGQTPPVTRVVPNAARALDSLAASASEPRPERHPELGPADDEPAPAPHPEPPSSPASIPEPVSAPAPSPEPVASAVAAARFDWPSSTLVRYRMSGYFRGDLHGTAQVEWLRSDDRYQVLMEVRSGVLFARHMRSEGLITPQGLVPQRYLQDTHTLFQAPRRVKMLFEPDAVILANGQRATTLPGLQDSASQFVQLTYLFRSHPELLRSGHQIKLPLALPSHVSRWVYEVMQPEVIDTPIGAMETFQLKPRRAQMRHNDLKADIWFAPSLQYLPVRIRIALNDDTFVDLLISEAPQAGHVQ